MISGNGQHSSNGHHEPKNVLGTLLEACCMDPLTGFYRNGACDTGPEDVGAHVVCAQMTDEFLRFSQEVGNDLVTPVPEHDFPGLKAGDRWCLCVDRWKQALDAGVAPPVLLRRTHRAALSVVTLDQLRQFALDK
ncbi:MAG: DUF2237 domain-containing protein [Anaerolineae bacterium]|nr:DUF2237 domain-containing protein [Anaerolineae bacterium]